MDFKQCKVLADIKYCEATNVEYEQYYKDNYDSNFELTEPDTEYDGYIVILYAAYFPIKDENGQMINPEDIESFIDIENVSKLGTKTTVVSIHTITGFDSHGLSSCVDPSRYDMNIGKKFAKEKAVDAIWAGLGFVLQWAKFGLKQKPVTSKYPAHIERVIAEHDELRERSVKLANFISGNEIFKTLSEDEQNDMKDQLMHMQKYIDCLHSRLIRSGVDASDI